MNLYRYISFENFMSLLIEKKERYVRPITWDDKYEGLVYNFLDSDKQRDLLLEIYKNICPRNYYATIDNYFRYWYAKYWTYAQSWTKLKESDAMWRIYSYGNHSIQIQTTEESITKLLQDNFNEGDNKITKEIREIKYDLLTEEDVIKQHIEQTQKTLDVYEPYFHKRKAFEHEKEYRVVVVDKTLYFATQLSSFGAKYNFKQENLDNCDDEKIVDEIMSQINKQRIDWTKEVIDGVPNAIYAEITDLSEYIKKVTVNPFAEDWFVDLVKKICMQYGVEEKFAGKSKLYEKP